MSYCCKTGSWLCILLLCEAKEIEEKPNNDCIEVCIGSKNGSNRW